MAEAKEEQSRRMAEEQMESVKAQLLRKLSLKSVQQAVEEERQRLVQEEKKKDVEADMIRAVAARAADRESEQEQQRQVREPRQVPADVAAALHRIHDSLVDAVRQFHEHNDAQHQAEAEDHKTVLLEQLQRGSNARLVDRQEEEERQRRLTEPVPEALLASLSEINSAVERQANLKAVHQAEALEQAQRVQADRMGTVHDQLMHRVHGREADAAMEMERQERITADRMAQLHEAVIRYKAVKDAINAEEYEQARRCVERTKSMVLDDMLARLHRKEAACLSEAAREEQHELAQSRTPEMKAKFDHALSTIKLQPIHV